MSKVKHAESEKCFRDICIEDNYTHQFDLANKESDDYRFIWAEFFLTDIKEVTTIDNQNEVFDIALVSLSLSFTLHLNLSLSLSLDLSSR